VVAGAAAKAVAVVVDVPPAVEARAVVVAAVARVVVADRAAAARVVVEEAVAPAVAGAAGNLNPSRSSGASLLCGAPLFC
jgi:hypothetical protein